MPVFLNCTWVRHNRYITHKCSTEEATKLHSKSAAIRRPMSGRVEWLAWSTKYYNECCCKYPMDYFGNILVTGLEEHTTLTLDIFPPFKITRNGECGQWHKRQHLKQPPGRHNQKRKAQDVAGKHYSSHQRHRATRKYTKVLTERTKDLLWNATRAPRTKHSTSWGLVYSQWVLVLTIWWCGFTSHTPRFHRARTVPNC